jgi:UDP-GlcNAc3NAcA epimerase
MPEEINRIMADHASTLLFSPTVTGINNLVMEGFQKDSLPPFSADHPGIFHCGDVMYDNSLYFETVAREKSDVLHRLGLENTPFYLATVHRDNNTDQPERLNAIFGAFHEITMESKLPLVLPLHPRTAKLLEKNLDKALFEKVNTHPYLKLVPPVSFLDMILLEKNCQMVFTDSGGVQKEAYFFNKPAVILRSETEWKEIVEQGCGIVANAFQENILQAARYFRENAAALKFPPLFGNGKAAEFIAETLLQNS